MRILIIIFFFSITAVAQNPVSITLHSGWKFRSADSGTWHKAEVPGNVHHDLLMNKLIPDPFAGMNEKKVQWIEKKDWIYETYFEVPDSIINKKHIELQFEGLDTYADVYVNDSLILQTNNMFRTWAIEIKSLIKNQPFKNNLRLYFHSPINVVMDKCLGNGFIYPADNDCDSCKTSPYTRKSPVHYGWDFAPRLVTSGIWKGLKLTGRNEMKPIYSNSVITKHSNIRFINAIDSFGRNFCFTVNDTPVFIRGGNYIPISRFHQTKPNYQVLFKRLKELNVNMIRVWGGGVYEDDEFYKLADEYGIWVWQDLMFANTFYPSDSVFEQNVFSELKENVTRISGHQSLALVCGNNEIEVALKNWGWKEKYQGSSFNKIVSNYYRFFNTKIIDFFEGYDFSYLPTSPQSNWGRAEDFKYGDNHFWGVWHGEMPFESYLNHIPRFMSEYGFPSFPSYKSIKYFNGSINFSLSDSVINFHQKSYKGNRLILKYHDWYYKRPKHDSDYVWTTQLLQADAYKMAAEVHRRAKPFCMGTMLWQLNDYWPGITWSIIDYSGECKPAYFRIKEAYKTVLVSPIVENDTVKVYVVSDSTQNFYAQLHLELCDFNGRKIFEHKQNIFLKNDSGLLVFLKPIKDFLHFNKQRFFFKATVFSGNRQLSVNLVYFDTIKNLELENPRIQIKSVSKNQFTIQSKTLCKGVYLYHPSVTNFSDNGFDLLPGEKKVIHFEGNMNMEELRKKLFIRCLNELY